MKAGYLVDENVGAAWFQMPADRVWYTEETIGRLGGAGATRAALPRTQRHGRRTCMTTAKA